MRKFVDCTYVEMTEEETEQMKDIQERFEAQEVHRPLSEAEVQSIVLKAQINTVDISDNLSVRMKNYYPTFEESVGQTVKLGFKFTYVVDGEMKLFKTVQPDLTIQAHYPPGTGTESLYARIDEVHIGNKYDPIPYEGNMVLENGKYYTQNGVMYLCNRDTGNPVYNALSELVGLYVDVVGI